MFIWLSVVNYKKSMQTAYCGTLSAPFIRREKIPDFVFVRQGAPNDRSDPDSYLYWIVCISGVVVLPLALLHAALWPPYAAYIGAIVSLSCLIRGYFYSVFRYTLSLYLLKVHTMLLVVMRLVTNCVCVPLTP